MKYIADLSIEHKYNIWLSMCPSGDRCPWCSMGARCLINLLAKIAWIFVISMHLFLAIEINLHHAAVWQKKKVSCDRPTILNFVRIHLWFRPLHIGDEVHCIFINWKQIENMIKYVLFGGWMPMVFFGGSVPMPFFGGSVLLQSSC